MGVVVEKGQSGFVIPRQDVNALANTLYEALSDMDQLEKLGMYGRTLSDTKYSWKQIGLETVALYESLIPGKSE
jgi:glycosyltransferase involved in cell wall biosynthesis